MPLIPIRSLTKLGDGTAGRQEKCLSQNIGCCVTLQVDTASVSQLSHILANEESAAVGAYHVIMQRRLLLAGGCQKIKFLHTILLVNLCAVVTFERQRELYSILWIESVRYTIPNLMDKKNKKKVLKSSSIIHTP